MALDFLNAIDQFLDISASNDNVTDTECDKPLVDDALFYQFSLIPSILILLTFALTQTRRQLMLDVLKGRPGLISPMDIASKRHRLSYACAFGSTVYLIFQCILNNFRIIDYHGPIALATLIVLVSVLVFGVVHFPVFACLTVGSAYGYGLGAIYTWMLTIVSIVRIFSCDVHAIARVLLILRNGPYLICLFYLSVTIPARFCGALKKRRIFVHCQEGGLSAKSLDAIRSSNQGVHVRNLLKRPVKETGEGTNFTRIMNFIRDHTYRAQPGFQYTARLLSTMLVAFIMIYALSFEILTLMIIYIVRMNEGIRQISDRQNAQTMEAIMRYLSGITISSVCISLLLAVYGLMRLFISYRETMYRMYRGDLDQSMRRTDYASHLIGAMKYSGFQVVYVLWGFVIHIITFLIICSIFAFIFGSLSNGHYQWLTDGLLQLWPIVLWTIIIYVGQNLVAKYAILQFPDKSIDITNRRLFFILTYFMFFYNIFLGFFSCVLRILKAVIIGALIVPRLDQSNLPTLYDKWDPGYVAYVGFMKLECAQTHPVMLVFLRVLMTCAKKRRSAGSKGQNAVDDEKNDWTTTRKCSLRRREDHFWRTAKQRATAFKWHVLYTLINNPDLRMLRKGYLQKVKLAKELGLPIPKSDTTFIDIDTILQEVPDLDSNGSLLTKASRVAEHTIGAILENVRHKIRGNRDTDDDDDDDDDEKGDGAVDGHNDRIKLHEGGSERNRHLSEAAHDNIAMTPMRLNDPRNTMV